MVPGPQPLAGGQRRFRFVECLGRGGFGEVYRASMTDRGGVRTDVAVKLLHDDVDPANQALKRLRDEAHVLAALRHPAILKVHDLVVLEGRVALVAEFVEGEDLSGLFKAKPRIPARPLLDVVGQIASALAAAHGSRGPSGQLLGLVHRDVKPQNIRIGRHGEVKLLDFGIARGDGIERSASTTEGSIVGSWGYMSPEAMDGAVTSASDLFSLGCVLLEGLGARRPWSGMEPRQLYAEAMKPGALDARIAERLAEIGPDTPPPLRALAAELLSVDPEGRPTAAETARRAEDLLDRLQGPTLRRWCTEREWAEPARRRGEFDGREVVEGEVTGGPLVPPAVKPPPAAGPVVDSGQSVASGLRSADPAAQRSRDGTSGTLPTRAVAMAASGMVGLMAGVIALATTVALGIVAVSLSSAPPTTPVATKPAPVVRPAPPPPPPVPDPVPAPVVEEPTAPVGPRPARPVAPEAPPQEPPGLVRAESKTTVPLRVRGAGGTFAVPADVAPGAWTVEAKFGSGWTRVDTVDVGSGEIFLVQCKQLLQECSVAQIRR